MVNESPSPNHARGPLRKKNRGSGLRSARARSLRPRTSLSPSLQWAYCGGLETAVRPLPDELLPDDALPELPLDDPPELPSPADPRELVLPLLVEPLLVGRE